MDNDSTRYAAQQPGESPESSLACPPGGHRRQAGGENSKGTLARRIRREAVPVALRVLAQLALWWITKDPRHLPGGHWDNAR